MKRGFEARWNEAKAIILTRPRPRPGFLALRPRPLQGLNIPGSSIADRQRSTHHCELLGGLSGEEARRVLYESWGNINPPGEGE